MKLLNPEVDISMIAMESARKCIGSGMIIGKLLLYLSMCTRDNPIKCYQLYSDTCYDANNSLIINNMQTQSTVLGCSSSEGSRSAGDGGSESNYATVNDKSNQKNSILCDEDDEEEEESHYSLIRKPDGQADEGPYSTLR